MGAVRFFLALIVLMAHAGLSVHTIGSLAAVQAFFILSGMYMAAVYTAKYSRVPRSARDFYLNRVLRLYPTYLILFALTFCCFRLMGTADPVVKDQLFDLFQRSQEVSGFERSLLWGSVITLVGQDFLSVHEPFHYMLPVRQSWSIATELLFYASVPLLFRYVNLKRCLVGFAALLGVKFVLFNGYGWRASYFLPVGNFAYFLLGYGAYLLSVNQRVEAFKASCNIVLKRSILFILLLMLACFGEASFERSSLLHHLVMVMCFTAACVVLFERGEGGRLDLLLGNLAYGIYLNHFLLIVVLKIVLGTSLPRPWFVVCVIGASFCTAFLMEKLLQEPIDRWRRARTMQRLNS
jgi:peptidoglycan/LPS O-acetylase OafA/YrhL